MTASDEMHQSILDFRENTGKPVVVSMGSTAASGAYYISTAADRIVANETTLTGSLGVIFQLNNFAEAADKYGIGQVVIKSGKYKDMGNAFREMRPDEREIFQSIVDESYSEFVDVISEGRKIPKGGCERSQTAACTQAPRLKISGSSTPSETSTKRPPPRAGSPTPKIRPWSATCRSRPSPSPCWRAWPRRSRRPNKSWMPQGSIWNPSLLPLPAGSLTQTASCTRLTEPRARRALQHFSTLRLRLRSSACQLCWERLALIVLSLCIRSGIDRHGARPRAGVSPWQVLAEVLTSDSRRLERADKPP